MFERLPGGAEAHLAFNDAWWSGRGPRLLFILRLRASVASALDDIIGSAGIKALLGRELFPAALWHQSVSDRYADRPEMRERLLAAGATIQVPASPSNWTSCGRTATTRAATTWKPGSGQAATISPGTLGRWMLGPHVPRASQPGLF